MSGGGMSVVRWGRALRVVAVAAGAGLTVSLLTPVDRAWAAEVAPAAVFESERPSAPDSTPLPPVVTTWPEGDFEPDVDTSGLSEFVLEKALGHSVVEPPDPSTVDLDSALSVERSEFANDYTFKGGYGVMELGREPLNVESDGEWVPVSLTATRDEDGSWSVADHPLNPEFPAGTGDGQPLTISDDDFAVEFTLLDAGDAVARASWARGVEELESRVEYPEVFDGVDLAYSLTNGSVKETLILADVPGAGEASWSWAISAPGLDLVESETGGIWFLDPDGVVRFSVPQPIMWDSSAVPEVQQAADRVLEWDLVEQADGTWLFTLSADEAWLADPARVYPVHVDPTANYGDSNVTAYKSDGATRTDGVLVGNSRSGGANTYWRSQVLYGYSALFGKQVLAVSLFGDQMYEGTATTYTGSVNTSSCNGYSCVGTKLGNWAVGGSGTATDKKIGQQISDWVNASTTSKKLTLRGAETAGAYTYKWMATTLIVSYRSYGTISGSLPSTGAQTTVEPVLTIGADETSMNGLSYRFVIGTDGSSKTALENTAVYVVDWTSDSEIQVPPGELDPNTTYYWYGQIRDGYSYDELVARDASDPNVYFGTNKVVSFNTIRSLTTSIPIGPQPDREEAWPADGEVITSMEPTFSVPEITDDPNGAVEYEFRVATSGDGLRGQVATSGWITTPEWQVLPGVLHDGSTYTWSVRARDANGNYPNFPWLNDFTVDMRLGTSDPSPYDTAGPATVNLANGNLSLSFSSPTVSALGGPMGLGFSYNSQDVSMQGLTASYYDAKQGGLTTPSYTFTGKTPVLVRTDSQVHGAWAAAESPAPSVPADYYLVKWSGYITVPTTGTYNFGAKHDDGVRIWVKDLDTGDAMLDSWKNQAATSSVHYDSSETVTLTGGVPVPIVVEFYDNTGPSKIELWARTLSPTTAWIPVPASWYTREISGLPIGWDATSPIAGAAGVYASAKVNESSVVLTDITGGKHTYKKSDPGEGETSDGGYDTPKGEYGTLSLDDDGHVVLTEDDGTVYTFNAEGKVDSVTSPGDAKNPATPIASFRPQTGLLDRISDPLSLDDSVNPPVYTREVTFVYWTDTNANCPTDPANDYVNPGKPFLCRIIY